MRKAVLKRNWFEVPAGTPLVVRGRILLFGEMVPVVARADGAPLVGPDGPVAEAPIADSFLEIAA